MGKLEVVCCVFLSIVVATGRVIRDDYGTLVRVPDFEDQGEDQGYYMVAKPQTVRDYDYENSQKQLTNYIHNTIRDQIQSYHHHSRDETLSDILDNGDKKEDANQRDYLQNNMERLKRMLRTDFKRKVGINDYAHREDYIRNNYRRLKSLFQDDYAAYAQKKMRDQLKAMPVVHDIETKREADQKVVPVEKKEAAPAEKDASTIKKKDAAAPVKKEATAPVTLDVTESVKKDATPVKKDATAPAKKDASTLVKEDASTPVKEDATAPVKEDATAPVKEDATAPVKNDATAPVKNDAIAPVKNDAATPVRKDAATPVRKVEKDNGAAITNDDAAPKDVVRAMTNEGTRKDARGFVMADSFMDELRRREINEKRRHNAMVRYLETKREQARRRDSFRRPRLDNYQALLHQQRIPLRRDPHERIPKREFHIRKPYNEEKRAFDEDLNNFRETTHDQHNIRAKHTYENLFRDEQEDGEPEVASIRSRIL